MNGRNLHFVPILLPEKKEERTYVEHVRYAGVYFSETYTFLNKSKLFLVSMFG